MLSYGEPPADDALLRRRIQAAIGFRETLGIDATAYRLIHGEADLLPSLIVDRYGDYLVVQALSQGMDRLLPQVIGRPQRICNGRAASSPATIRGRGRWKDSSSGSRSSAERCPNR